MAESKQTREKRNAQNRERYAWLRSRGFCTSCGCNYNEPGYVVCRDCLKNRKIYDMRYDPTGERRRANGRKRRAEREAAGLCTECGKPLDIPGKVCMACKEKRRDCVRVYKIKQRMKRDANRLREKQKEAQ